MKRTLLVFCLIAAANSVFAQKVTPGLKAGVNITNFTGGNFEDVEKNALVGFHGGGFINISLGAFSIQPEVLVSTAGVKIEEAGESQNIKLTYLTVPVIAKYRTTGGFYLEAGPQVGFKLSEDIGESTIDDFAKNLDLALCAGLGFQTKSGFGIGGRYLVGISKVGDFDPSSGVDPDFQNSVIQIGIFFALKGKK
ncbi:MAG: PorT family protein [Chitinophagaceae bacterium]|nr:PorT family protein [Chitinophagaceae bacterium]